LDLFLNGSASSATEINCYGYGCYEMQLFLQQQLSFFNVTINLNTCGLCDSYAACISWIQILCLAPDYSYFAYWYSAASCSQFECSCGDICSTFISDDSVNECAYESDSDTDSDTNNGGGSDSIGDSSGGDGIFSGSTIYILIAVVVVGFVIFVCVYWCCCCRRSKKEPCFVSVFVSVILFFVVLWVFGCFFL
jgi:hypothetical protein